MNGLSGFARLGNLGAGEASASLIPSFDYSPLSLTAPKYGAEWAPAPGLEPSKPSSQWPGVITSVAQSLPGIAKSVGDVWLQTGEAWGESQKRKAKEVVGEAEAKAMGVAKYALIGVAGLAAIGLVAWLALRKR